MLLYVWFLNSLIIQQIQHFFTNTNVHFCQVKNEVVQFIIDGYSYKMIAEKRNISINTVNEYIKRIYTKLQINSKGQLFAIYNSQKKI